jgi:excisionase family DNA binding protein
VEEEYLTVKETATLIGVSPSSIWQAIRENRLPCVTRYGRKLVIREDVEAYRQRTQPDGVKSKGRPRKKRE